MLCLLPPGLMIEGLGVMLTGLWGSGVGLSSYSGNIGAIGITKVSSFTLIEENTVLLVHPLLWVKLSHTNKHFRSDSETTGIIIITKGSYLTFIKGSLGTQGEATLLLLKVV